MKIAVIRFSALGDIAASLPVLRALKYKPTIITSEIGRELLKDEFDNFLILKNKDILTVLKLILKIRKEKFDLIIDLQSNDRSKFIAKFSNSKEYVNSLNVDFNQKATFIFRDIAKKASFDILNQLNQDFRNKNRSYIVFNCGSSPRWKSKRLPIEKWKEIYIFLKEKYDLPIYLTGEKNEYTYLENISKHLDGNIINLAGKTSIQELKIFLKEAFLTVSTDSAAMHISAAQGTPTIGLFGATNWIKSAPYGMWSIVIFDDIFYPDGVPPSKNLLEVRNYYKNLNINKDIEKISYYLSR
ncbi:MAG: hypothetical protein CL623_08325 [Arcobacter sp.]|nr:hypothetical protein [Arcobacter sp.]|tara:strand:- start:7636 stop:8532 length:897 start_codon:yes stop_codon:yes gene_type:complete